MGASGSNHLALYYRTTQQILRFEHSEAGTARHTSNMIIKVRENEPFEAAMRRFKRSIEKTGLLTDLRAREAYEKPTTERKRKHAAACKRHYKRIRSMQLPPKLY